MKTRDGSHVKKKKPDGSFLNTQKSHLADMRQAVKLQLKAFENYSQQN